MAVKAVFFDVGETLVDETRHWTAVAEAVGVPAFTFFAVAGALIERGVRDHRQIFDELEVDPGALELPPFGEGDFYPDALPCLETLRAAGYIVGVVGNTSTQAEDQDVFLADAHALPANVIDNLRWLVPLALDRDVAVPVAVRSAAPEGSGLTEPPPAG